MRIPVKYMSDKGDPGGNGEAPVVEEQEERAAPVQADYLEPEPEEDWKTRYVRLLADFDNYRKHSRSERERLAEVGKDAVIRDLIPVIEHLERACQAAEQGGHEGISAGLKMTLSELYGVLRRHGVEKIPTMGEEFNPALHEAVASIPRAGAKPNTVIEEVRPGFMREGKLLRPASVVVAA